MITIIVVTNITIYEAKTADDGGDGDGDGDQRDADDDDTLASGMRKLFTFAQTMRGFSICDVLQSIGLN